MAPQLRHLPSSRRRRYRGQHHSVVRPFIFPMLRHLPYRRRYRYQHSVDSKAPKRTRKDTINVSADRLSDLPDTLLCHILSFIDTKYAVATSILSKRWKHLYISVPNIILDDSLTRNIRNEESFTVFAMFGLKQITHRTVPHINLFRLKCDFIFKYHLIKTLVSAAIFRNVKEFDICISMANSGNVSLPPEVFTSRSLAVLKLTGVLKLTKDYESSEDDEPVPSVVLSVVLVVPDLVSLPSLKVLHLGSFVLNSSVNRLFQGCVLLEDLCLSRCIYEVDDVLFPFPFLRKLSIKGGRTWDCIDRIGLAIDAPNLELFEYHAEMAKFLWMREPMSNGIAKFNFWETKLGALLQFITELRGFKSLYLLESAPEDFFEDNYCDAPLKAPAFETLTRLEFCSSFIGILPNILDCAPQLEVLVIHKLCAYEEITVEGFERETAPTCLTEHLRNIEFRLYISNEFKLEQDLEVMKYFLQNGKVLERMKISIECWFYECYDQQRSTPSSIRKSVLEKLKMLQGFSKTCEVFIEY